MRTRYRGPTRKGWQHGATYDLQLRRFSPFQIHVGTIWSYNNTQNQVSPIPIRIRTFRRFFGVVHRRKH